MPLMSFQSPMDFAKHLQSKLGTRVKKSQMEAQTNQQENQHRKLKERINFIRMVEDSMDLELYELLNKQHLRNIEECEKNIVAIEN